MRLLILLCFASAVFLSVACGPRSIIERIAPTSKVVAIPTPTPNWSRAPFQSRIEFVTKGLLYPNYLVAPFDGTDRLFVLERAGLIRILQAGTLLEKPFLDLRERVAAEREQALHNLVFAPDFSSSGIFYVTYNRKPDGALVLERYRVSENPNLADVTSATEVLVIPHPVPHHHAGQLLFGKDGYLYFSVGEGSDPFKTPSDNAQQLDNLLGKILRLDVSSLPYKIPPTNPFVNDATARPEIWAYGLRNPWRMFWDKVTDDFFIADVGDLDYEELDVLKADEVAGKSFGWPRMEASHCSRNNLQCDVEGFVLPAFEYPHAYGCAIVGGVVYRGEQIPKLNGQYLFSDWCTGYVWAMERDGSNNWRVQELASFALRLSAIAQGEDGGVYLADYRSGGLYRLVVR